MKTLLEFSFVNKINNKHRMLVAGKKKNINILFFEKIKQKIQKER